MKKYQYIVGLKILPLFSLFPYEMATFSIISCEHPQFDTTLEDISSDKP